MFWLIGRQFKVNRARFEPVRTESEHMVKVVHGQMRGTIRIRSVQERAHFILLLITPDKLNKKRPPMIIVTAGEFALICFNRVF
jgi:hypothetical protein